MHGSRFWVLCKKGEFLKSYLDGKIGLDSIFMCLRGRVYKKEYKHTKKIAQFNRASSLGWPRLPIYVFLKTS